MPDIGELGEQLVAGWLQAQDWVILHHRWRCRWGEIDLIAQREERGSKGKWESGGVREFAPITSSPHHSITPSPLLAFVEVKTRSRGNWDADGLLAITPQKQAKLWQTAQMFLAERPDLTNLPCRFDVALVSCQRVSQGSRRDRTDFSSSSETMGKAIQVPPVQLGQPILLAGYRLILQDYIQSAFD
jgi:putative endonuclease